MTKTDSTRPNMPGSGTAGARGRLYEGITDISTDEIQVLQDACQLGRNEQVVGRAGAAASRELTGKATESGPRLPGAITGPPTPENSRPTLDRVSRSSSTLVWPPVTAAAWACDATASAPAINSDLAKRTRYRLLTRVSFLWCGNRKPLPVTDAEAHSVFFPFVAGLESNFRVDSQLRRTTHR
jgi:hypothetical protein